MRLVRLTGVVLIPFGAVRAFLGSAWPCSPTPVVSQLDWVPSCGDTLVVATFGTLSIVTGALVLFVDLRGTRSAIGLRRLMAALGVSIVAFLAILASLPLVPVHQSFRMSDVRLYDLASTWTGIDTIKGITVSFHWWAAANISFGAWSCTANHIVYDGNGTEGSGNLVSQGGAYEFATACPPSGLNCVGADVAGNYTRPLLEI